MSERCSNCGRAGHAVPLTLVRHHVIDAWLGRLEEKDFRFCEAPGCDVVYFEVQGETIGTQTFGALPRTRQDGRATCSVSALTCPATMLPATLIQPRSSANGCDGESAPAMSSIPQEPAASVR